MNYWGYVFSMNRGLNMSTQFLRLLDNQRGRQFTKYVEQLDHDARIAWYPSAGTDFRALFYLNDAFLSTSPTIEGKDPAEPDIYLYSDWNLMSNRFEEILFHGGNPVIHDDGRSKVTLSDIEDLGQLKFDPYPAYQLTEKNALYYNRVFFFYATIESATFGTITKPVLYAFCCNEQLCSELLLPLKARVSHVIHVRYGHGFGGANCSGHWIQHTLAPLQCEVYIHDGLAYHDRVEAGIINYYGDVIPQEQISTLTTIREIDGRGWSDCRTIVWQKVSVTPDVFPTYSVGRIKHIRRRTLLLQRVTKSVHSYLWCDENGTENL